VQHREVFDVFEVVRDPVDDLVSTETGSELVVAASSRSAADAALLLHALIFYAKKFL